MVNFRPKPPAWNLNPAEVEPRWKWFWEDTFALPFWANDTNPEVVNPFAGVSNPGVRSGTNLDLWKLRSTVVGQAMWNFATEGIWLDLGVQKFLPEDKVTIICIRQRDNLTTRLGALFSTEVPTAGNYLSALVPTNDNDVDWDFANNTTGRITWTGYVPSQELEVWVFRAGPSGPQIWLDGVLRQSSGTASPARTNHATKTFRLLNQVGEGGVGTHVTRLALFALSKREWSDQQIIEVSRDPFGPFYKFNNPAINRTPIAQPSAVKPIYVPVKPSSPIFWRGHTIL